MLKSSKKKAGTTIDIVSNTDTAITAPLFQSKFHNNSLVHILIIVVIGFICYSNTFNSPFQWDESEFIQNNPIVKNLDFFVHPETAVNLKYYDALKGRYVGYLTFALNYRFNGLDVTGYHVVNLSIHIMNAILVYFFVVFTFRTPFLIESSLAPRSKLIALFSALLFVAHPIQTEAVTYIFQRLASLVAFFYLLSVVLYIKSRQTEGKKQWIYYAFSILSVILAMKTKENAFTLPVVIALYEFSFFKGSVKQRIAWLAPILLSMLIIPLTLIGIDKPVGAIAKGLMEIPDGNNIGISRADYFLTQIRVIVTYIRLLFLPVNQNLDYDYPLYNSFSQVIPAFVFLCSILALGIYLFRRSNGKNHASQLIAFGIYWFFITISVESSIIPIPMIICEYRAYLPSIGVFFGITILMFIVFERMKMGKRLSAVSIFICVFMVFSFATYKRNEVWKSTLSLREDALGKSPQKARCHFIVGTILRDEGLDDKALYHFKITVDLDPNFAEAYNDMGVIYATKNLEDEALNNYQKALAIKPNFAEAEKNIALIYLGTDRINEAKREMEKAALLDPNNDQIKKFLAYISSRKH